MLFPYRSIIDFGSSEYIPLEIVHTKVHTNIMKIAGFEWDQGNWPKCGKHGVSQDEIEHVLKAITFRIPDPHPDEPRYRTAGENGGGRHVFIVYMHRAREDGMYLRPISARYMHDKEVKEYEHVKTAMAKPTNR